jgi:methanogenic corrinoid protein MtbC1
VHVIPAPATCVGAILTAVRSFDQARVVDVLDQADATHGLDTTIDEVVFPSLRVVGTFWSSGTVDVAHEHLLSRAVARWVAARTAVLPRPTRQGTLLLAAGPDDMHTLALDCLDLLLAARGVEVCNLGAQTPVSSLLVVVGSVHPTAVVLSSHTPTVAGHAVHSVRAVAEAGLPVYFAGSSFASPFLRQNLPGVALDGTLRESAELLALRHTSPSAEAVPLRRERSRPSAAASA